MANKNQNVNWEANNFRITVFPKAPSTIDLDYQKLWPKIDKALVKTQTRSPVTGEFRQEASYNNNKLALIAIPVKYDLIYVTENPVVAAPPYGFAFLGNFTDKVNEFVEISENWLDTVNLAPASRIAFGVDLFKREQNVKDGYRTLSSLLPFKIDPNKSTDFRLQINKFVPSKTEKSIVINRLTSWGVLQVKTQATSALKPEAPLDYPDIVYSHLNVDINTAPENNPTFNQSQLKSIFGELVTEARQLSKEGVDEL
jgi:hypothetical protein